MVSQLRHVHEVGREPGGHVSWGRDWDLAWLLILKKLVSFGLYWSWSWVDWFFGILQRSQSPKNLASLDFYWSQSWVNWRKKLDPSPILNQKIIGLQVPIPISRNFKFSSLFPSLSWVNLEKKVDPSPSLDQKFFGLQVLPWTSLWWNFFHTQVPISTRLAHEGPCTCLNPTP